MKSLRIFSAVLIYMLLSFIVPAQTADEVVTRHIEAIGGIDAWKKVNSLKIDGVLNIQGNEIIISLIQLHGKGMRQNITVQGMMGYQIVTPTQGWTFMPFHGQTEVSAMSDEEVKQAQNELDTHGSLIEYKEKGHTVELSGTENIGGTDCYKILLTLNSGKKATIYIDSKNYYVVRTITRQTANAQEQEIETNFSSFEKITDGLIVAKSITLPYGIMKVSTVQVNTAIDENVFKPVYSADKSYTPR